MAGAIIVHIINNIKFSKCVALTKNMKYKTPLDTRRDTGLGIRGTYPFLSPLDGLRPGRLPLPLHSAWPTNARCGRPGARDRWGGN